MEIKKFLRNKLDSTGKINTSVFIKKVKNFDIVSFDIFDTLIKRNVPEPSDVFELVAYRCKIPEFRSIRIKAERDARKCTGKDVRLDDIYNYMPEKYKMMSEKLKETEIQLEKELCVVNYDLVRFYNYCIRYKKVILISDMYMERKTIIDILNKNGIKGYIRLFISNEICMTKSEGSLYRYIKKTLENKKTVIHFGNSFKGDYLRALENGFVAVRIPTKYCRMNRKYLKQPSKEKKLEIVETFINNNTYQKGFLKKFGFECLGPLVYSFTRWLYDKFREDGIEQVLFFSRDGYIIKKIFDILGYNKEIPSVYLEVSRRSLEVPGYSDGITIEKFKSEAGLGIYTSFSEIFYALGLDYMAYRSLVLRYGFGLRNRYLRDELLNSKAFKNLFMELVPAVVENARLENGMLKLYLNKFDFSKKTAFVDLGWAGSIQKFLQKHLDKNIPYANIHGYYLGLEKRAEKVLEGNNAKAFLFDCFNNHNSKSFQKPFIGLIKNCFTESKGSVKQYIYINGRYEAVREENEILNFSKSTDNINDIHKGAILFCKKYKNYENITNLTLDGKTGFYNFYKTGCRPTIHDAKILGELFFENNGTIEKIASPGTLLHNLANPVKAVTNFRLSQWKAGYIKRLLYVNLPYDKALKYASEYIKEQY